MKPFLPSLLTAALWAPSVMIAPAQAVEWSHDLDAAMKQAETEGKLVLIEFTGSDWCTYCIQLNRQVLSRPDFAEQLRPHFIPVQIDVPIRHDFDPQLLKRNQQLCQRYKVPGFPTLMVLTPQGQVVGGFRSDPGNGMEGVLNHLSAALKFACMLAEAETQQGETKARSLYAVYSALQPCMRPCTGLRERIAKLDPNNVTGIHQELKEEEQRTNFRRELTSAREPQVALALAERYLPDATGQFRAEILQAKVAVMLATARTQDDLLAAKALLWEIADLTPETAQRVKNTLEQRFSNPEGLLEQLRQNPPQW